MPICFCRLQNSFRATDHTVILSDIILAHSSLIIVVVFKLSILLAASSLYV